MKSNHLKAALSKYSSFLGRTNGTQHFSPISSDFCTQKEGAYLEYTKQQIFS